MSERWVVEGTWSGYTSAQKRVVHRDVISKKTAERIRELGAIAFTDGTWLDLSVRKAELRERVVTVSGYRSLINECLALGVSRVADIQPERARRIAERGAAEGAR